MRASLEVHWTCGGPRCPVHSKTALGARFSLVGHICSQPSTAMTALLHLHQRDVGFLPLLRASNSRCFFRDIHQPCCPSWQNRMSGCLKAVGTGILTSGTCDPAQTREQETARTVQGHVPALWHCQCGVPRQEGRCSHSEHSEAHQGHETHQEHWAHQKHSEAPHEHSEAPQA